MFQFRTFEDMCNSNISTKGEIALVEENHKVYSCLGELGHWEPYSETTAGMSLYDINQNVISQMPDLSEENLTQKKKLIRDYFVNTNGKYYMLLNRDNNYYTLFNINPESDEPDAVEDIVIECLNNLGSIKSIEDDDGQAIEIWTCRDNTASISYLFKYDSGVVECHL